MNEAVPTVRLETGQMRGFEKPNSEYVSLIVMKGSARVARKEEKGSYWKVLRHIVSHIKEVETWWVVKHCR